MTTVSVIKDFYRSLRTPFPDTGGMQEWNLIIYNRREVAIFLKLHSKHCTTIQFFDHLVTIYTKAS